MNMIATDTTGTFEGPGDLSKYDGPYYPFDALHAVYHHRRSLIDRTFLHKVTAALALGSLSGAPYADGYKWYYGAFSRLGDGMVVLLFPWRNDVEGHRHITLYRKGVIEQKVLNTFVQNFCNTVMETLRATDEAADAADTAPASKGWWVVGALFLAAAAMIIFGMHHPTISS
jgi:hypothetical protein